MGKAALVLLMRNFVATEAGQMLRRELCVQQHEAALAQGRHKIDQGDLAGVGRATQHAVAEEGAAQRIAVETADERYVRPAVHTTSEERRVGKWCCSKCSNWGLPK